ncbi:MAG: hypothetical protein AAF242_02640, partial [Bacteroidota bacterium]
AYLHNPQNAFSMIRSSLFLYEWKHFIRSPFKVVALLLFVIASLYGLHNGASLYHKQTSEIEGIKEEIAEDFKTNLAYYDEGKKGPEDQPWVDMTAPFWAVYKSGAYHFKTPSPALVYSIGQAEQYGFYKSVNFYASPYDADMTKEIANPERLQTGTLDFSFALLYLAPLLLLILLYNLQSAEAEQGFLPLIEVQTTSKNSWLFTRVSFYALLLLGTLSLLILYGALLTNVFSTAGTALGQMFMYSFLYLLFWSLIYYLILRSGKQILSNTLKMVGIWLLFAFLTPAVVHLWVSMKKPANLMTDWIDIRDEGQKLYDQADDVIQDQLDTLFPEIKDSPSAKDSTKSAAARSDSFAALTNELKKKRITPIEAENGDKNQLIRTSYWINPVTFFQNQLNSIAETHYNDYHKYRATVQSMVDKQVETLVKDTWDEVEVDKQRYLAYQRMFD